MLVMTCRTIFLKLLYLDPQIQSIRVHMFSLRDPEGRYVSGNFGLHRENGGKVRGS